MQKRSSDSSAADALCDHQRQDTAVLCLAHDPLAPTRVLAMQTRSSRHFSCMRSLHKLHNPTHTDICTYLYRRMFIHVYIHVHVHTHIHAYIYICMYVTDTYRNKYPNMHIHLFILVCSRMLSSFTQTHCSQTSANILHKQQIYIYTNPSADVPCIGTYTHTFMGVVPNSLFPKWPPSRQQKLLSRNFCGTIAVHDSDYKLI